MSSRYVLNVVYPTELAQSLSLSETPIVLGRSRQSDLCIEDEWVSRRHCQVWIQSDKIWVEDLNSTNGTYVDGQSINRQVNLNLGQRIQLGKIILQVFEQAESSDPHTMVLESIGDPWESYSSQYLIAIEADGFCAPDQPFAAITMEFLQHEVSSLIQNQCLSDEYLRKLDGGKYIVYSSSDSEQEANQFCESLKDLLINHRFQWQETPLPFQFRVQWINTVAGESDADMLNRAFSQNK